MLQDVSVKPVENRSWDDSFIRPRGSEKTEGEAVPYQTECGSGLASPGIVQDRWDCCAWGVPGTAESSVEKLLALT